MWKYYPFFEYEMEKKRGEHTKYANSLSVHFLSELWLLIWKPAGEKTRSISSLHGKNATHNPWNPIIPKIRDSGMGFEGKYYINTCRGEDEKHRVSTWQKCYPLSVKYSNPWNPWFRNGIWRKILKGKPAKIDDLTVPGHCSDNMEIHLYP